VEMVECEAKQLRLKLEGGWPWETFATERTIYQIQHGDANWKSKSFRALSMIPALLLPPKWFYAGRRWLGSQTWYKRARTAAVPVPGFPKLDSLPGRPPGAMLGTRAADAHLDPHPPDAATVSTAPRSRTP